MEKPRPILLFTDFGLAGPYVGQVKAVLAEAAPDAPVIDLMHDAPAHAPRPSAYLLAALASDMPADAVCLAVVDPGVGSDRPAVVLAADGRWFVGPGNGLFEPLRRRTRRVRRWRIAWAPGRAATGRAWCRERVCVRGDPGGRRDIQKKKEK